MMRTMTTLGDQTKLARNRIGTMAAAGAALALIGVILVGVPEPAPTVDALGNVETTSDWRGLVGLAALWAGSFIATVGAIGYGVRLGREASPRE